MQHRHFGQKNITIVWITGLETDVPIQTRAHKQDARILIRINLEF